MNGLDVVAVGIEHVRRVIAGVISGAKAGGSVVTSAGTDRGGVEGVDRCPVSGGKREVQRWAWLSLGDPQVLAAPGPEAKSSTGLDLAAAPRCERGDVEASTHGEIRDVESDVVEESERGRR